MCWSTYLCHFACNKAPVALYFLLSCSFTSIIFLSVGTDQTRKQQTFKPTFSNRRKNFSSYINTPGKHRYTIALSLVFVSRSSRLFWEVCDHSRKTSFLTCAWHSSEVIILDISRGCRRQATITSRQDKEFYWIRFFLDWKFTPKNRLAVKGQTLGLIRWSLFSRASRPQDLAQPFFSRRFLSRLARSTD